MPIPTGSRPYAHRTARSGPDGFRQFADQLRSGPGWTVREVATGHNLQWTEPAWTAEILLGLR
jgi:hypothetical protein